MKLLSLFVVIACLMVSITGFAQQVTLTTQNSSLKAVFKEIEKQTGYLFLYDKQLLASAKPVSVSLKNASIKEALSVCLKGQKLDFSIEEKTIVITGGRLNLGDEKERTVVVVRGRVVDSAGKVLEGATVMGKNVKVLGVTDGEGMFSVNVKEGDVLMVSYVGYEERYVVVTKEILINASVVVVLRQIGGRLENIEVSYSTGYQKIAKERATGSFASIDSSIINRSIDPNILNRIDGLAPGVLFDKRNPAATGIQIRGVYSLNEDAAKPLIIVNNFPYTGNIVDINPNDIENITILRDAAAASIWGAQAGNGVIVITTKNGHFNQPLAISFNASVNVTGKPNLMDLPVLSTSDQIDLEMDYFNKGWFDAPLMDPSAPVPEVVSILDDQRNLLISPEDAKKKIDALRNLDVRRDYLKYLYRKAVQQQYALSLSGGTSVNKYYISLGYDKNLESVITNDDYRLTFQVGNTLKLSNAIQANVNITYANTAQNAFSQPITYGSTQLGTWILPQYSRLVDANGNPASVDAYYRGSFLDTLGQGMLLDWKFRPLDEARLADNKTRLNNLLASASIQATIAKGLTAEMSYQFQNSNSGNKNNQSLESYFARDAINSFTNLNETSQSKRYPIPMGGILDVVTTRSVAHNVRGQLGFSRDLNSDFKINVIAGAELRQVKNNVNQNRVYGYNNENLSYSEVDYVNQYPINYYGYYVRISSNTKVIETENRLVSLFFNSSYSFFNKYVLSASVRKDASNLFGVKSNAKGRPFYSIGTLWRTSNESFYHSLFLPTLSVRATVGTGGNILAKASASPIMTIVSASESNPATGLPYAYIGSLGNPTLKWEKVTTLNLGIDFVLKNNIISGTIEYYKKWSSDLYGSKRIDPSTGFILVQTNVANIKGSGLDVQINSKNLYQRRFKWYTTLNISRSQYKVTKYLVKPADKGLVTNGDVIFPMEGLNPYSMISYKWTGLDPANGDPQGFIDGKISKDYALLNQAEYKDLVVNGSALPLTFGNLLNTFSWKNFSLTTNITFRMDYVFRKQSINYLALTSGATHTDYLKRWQKSGDELITNVPSMAWPLNAQREVFYSMAEVNVLRADHIRWNDIQIAYNVTQKRLSKILVGNMSLFTTISNLNILIWKANRKGVDPEFQSAKPPIGFVLGARVNL